MRSLSCSQGHTRGHSDRGLSHTHGLSPSPLSVSRPLMGVMLTPRVSLTHSVTFTLRVSHTLSHPQTNSFSHTNTHTRGVFPHTLSPYTSAIPLTLKVPLTRTAFPSEGSALTRRVSHVPAACVARAGFPGLHPARGAGAARAWLPGPRSPRPAPSPSAALFQPRSPGAPTRGPLPRGGPAPPGCWVVLPPPPPRPLRPRPRHVTRSRIAIARAASGQSARLSAGLAGGGASGQREAAAASGIRRAAPRRPSVRSRFPGPGTSHAC